MSCPLGAPPGDDFETEETCCPDDRPHVGSSGGRSLPPPTRGRPLEASHVASGDETNDIQTNSSVAALVACQRSDVQTSLAINCDDPALAHGPKIGLLKIEHAVSVVESAHNLTPYVPEVALLRCVGTSHLVQLLLGRHDDPLLAQQNLGQACAPHEERARQGVRLNRAEVENPAREAVLSDECHKSIVEAFDVFGRKDACELRQKYAVVTVK